MTLRCKPDDLAMILLPSPNHGGFVVVLCEGDEPGDWIVRSLQPLLWINDETEKLERQAAGTIGIVADSMLQPIRRPRVETDVCARERRPSEAST